MKIVSFALLSLATAVDARLSARESPSGDIMLQDITDRSNGKHKFFSDVLIGREMFFLLVVTM
jgi:hypothetical protein